MVCMLRVAQGCAALLEPSLPQRMEVQETERGPAERLI